MKRETLSFIGLLNRGGLVAFSSSQIESKARRGSLLILAEDASGNTKKACSDLANAHHLPILGGASKEELGKALGYPEIAALLILDRKAGRKIMNTEGETA